MSEIRNLYVYSGSVDHMKILERLKECKAELDWPFLLKVLWVNDLVTVPVIAFEEPRYLLDHILIGPEMDSDAISDALRWAVLGEYSEAAVSVTDTLMQFFGFGVRELDHSETMEYTQQQDLKRASHRLKFEVKGDSRDGYR